MYEINIKDISALILAGGKSRRMGRDKGLLKYQGKSLCGHIIEAVAPCCSELFIVTKHPEYARFGIPLLTDNYSNKGPLAGIEAGLMASSKLYQLVLSCDMPLLSSTILKKLCVQASDTKTICHFNDQDRIQPLPGLYPTNLVSILQKSIHENQLSLSGFLKNQACQAIDLTAQEKKQLLNINNLSDYHQLNHDH